VALSALVSAYDNVILDLDGCVWLGEEPTPRAAEAIAALRRGGKKIAFVTNDPRRSMEDYVAKLWRMGVQASLADVVTVGGALQHLLAETRQGRTAFVIGTDALRRHVTDAGLKVMNGTDLATRADVVVVAGTEDVVYEDLRCATLAARRGGDLLGTSRDPTYPMPDGLWPGTGALVAAVEYASGRTAQIVGKPEPQLILTAIDRLGEGRTLVIGDRLDTDIAAAAKARVDAALVLTGGATREAAAAGPDPKPVAVADNLADLVMSAGPRPDA
jgi:HAD superfamily hydrolase (TIGR01450 family)